MTQAAFVEKDCTLTLGDKRFTSGGSFLLNCSDGYVRGVVYAKPEQRTVTDWHGHEIAKARYGERYHGNIRANFAQMQSVCFDFAGIRFTGRYCPEWNQSIRVKSTKPAKLPE